MRAVLKRGILVLQPDTDADRADLAAWESAHEGHVFALTRGGALRDIGPHDDACRTPINVVFDQGDPRWRQISNLAETPFELHGQTYASVEGFWQGLKAESDADRWRIAALWGQEAKRAGRDVETFDYRGKPYIAGRYEHWMLMREACDAKFAQNATARDALIATGDRPLTHRVKRDSRTIPGVVMAEIWMRIRARLIAPR